MKVTLLVPGYVDPQPELDWSTGLAQIPWQIQLNTALCTPLESLQLPAARLLNPDVGAAEFIICADPIHLQADRDTATLLPGAMLGISDSEADHLIASCNAFLAEDSLEMFRHSSTSWYLRGMDGTALVSHPPSFLAHRNASAYLPEGEGSAPWRRLMTELQMLLHTHPVNLDRQTRGKAPVNSVWFWGGAAMPADHDAENSARSANDEPVERSVLYSDEPYAIRLAAAHGCPCFSLAQFQPGKLTNEPDSHCIIVDTRISAAMFADDELALQEIRASIDTQWLATLRQSLRSGQIASVTLSNEDGARGELVAEPAWLQKTWGRLVGKMQRG